MLDLQKAYDTIWKYAITKQLHTWGFRGTLPTVYLVSFRIDNFTLKLATKTPQRDHWKTKCLRDLFLELVSSLLPSTIFSKIFQRISYVDDLTIYSNINSMHPLVESLQTEIRRLESVAKFQG